MLLQPPALLDGLSAARFRATFSVERRNTAGTYCAFVFDAKGPDDFNMLRLEHKNSYTTGAAWAYEFVDGQRSDLTCSHDLDAAPSLTSSDKLWVRITKDVTEESVTYVEVKMIESATAPGENDWAAQDWVMRVDIDEFTDATGGRIGFLDGDV